MQPTPPPGPPLTVGLLIDDGLDRPDGVQQYVLTLAAELQQLGHEVHLITSQTDRTDLTNLHAVARSLGVRFNGNKLATPLPAGDRTIRTLLDRVRLDVLHVQLPYSPFLAGRVISRVTPTTAVVGTFHIYPQSALVQHGTAWLGRLERRRLRRFDETIAVSEAAADFARSTFGLTTRVIGNPVSLDRFVPAAGATSTAPVHLVFLGRLVERKGPRQLVAAAAAMAERGTDTPWHMTIAGRGPLLADLTRQVRDAGLADRITFPGFISEEDKVALLQSADVVALPSTGGESFGISVVEALACANGPVIAGDNPGYRTTMRGFERQLVDPDDTVVFAALLSHWVDDAAARAAIAPRQQAAAHRFDAPAIAASVVETYRTALAGRRGASPAR